MFDRISINHIQCNNKNYLPQIMCISIWLWKHFSAPQLVDDGATECEIRGPV